MALVFDTIFFSFGHFLYLYCCYYIIGELGKIKRWAVWGLYGAIFFGPAHLMGMLGWVGTVFLWACLVHDQVHDHNLSCRRLVVP